MKIQLSEFEKSESGTISYEIIEDSVSLNRTNQNLKTIESINDNKEALISVMSNTDTIIINGLEFYAYHGASDQEQEVGHRYLIDVSLEIDAYPAGISDKLSETVNYSKVAKRIVQIGVGEQFRLLEALAHKISIELFLEFPQIEGMRLRVQKMCPPMNVIARSVGVEIYRRRDVVAALT